jgi:hypothetical protein
VRRPVTNRTKQVMSNRMLQCNIIYLEKLKIKDTTIKTILKERRFEDVDWICLDYNDI